MEKFSRTLRGYDPDEVNKFLDKIIVDYEKLYKENLASGKALFPSADFNFMNEYNTNFAKYDKLFARNRHFFYYKDIFADKTTSDADVLEDFKFDVNALLVTKQDSLQKIWDASRIEYSPL